MTHEPISEGVRGLVARWRAEAADSRGWTDVGNARANANERCASELEAALAAEGWRTMGSAPRDGSWILLYDADYKNPYLHAQFRRGAWWGQLTQSGRAVVWNDPRWWMPLPPPPALQAAGRRTRRRAASACA